MTIQTNTTQNRTRHSLTALGAAAGLLLTLSPALGQGRPATAHTARVAGDDLQGASVRTPLSRVPRSLVHRAQQHLEDHRLDGLGWAQASLAPVANAVHRPDVAGVAYIEFPVLPTGFVLVATAAHDVPIPHWSHEGQSIHARLVEGAAQLGREVARIQKLDALSYVAEDPNGSLIARVGPLSGPALELLERSVLASTGSSRESHGALSQAWSEYKSRYIALGQSALASLAEEAREAWEFEHELQYGGMALRQGETHLLALLPDSVRYMVTGPAADLVDVERVPTAGGASVLRMTITGGVPLGSTLEFEITTILVVGARTLHRFFVDGRGHTDPFPEEEPDSQYSSGWSSWTYYWAGSYIDQCNYGQIAKCYTSLSCWSGCGATAWAMLIGWVDRQAAAGNPRWVNNNGVYREDGGYGSAMAVAPETMYSGLTPDHEGIESILLEIRGYLDTFCIGSSGATYAGNMDEVNQYFQGRTAASAVIDYVNPGLFKARLREQARDSIKDNGTPAIIGIGGLDAWNWHYPLAYGYKWRKKSNFFGTKYQREFRVNQGNSADLLVTEWINAKTWFCGEIIPS